tara:strand:- start:131 stop:295 length:165 start_codon:yes stop_codon:yes gene_type:complete
VDPLQLLLLEVVVVLDIMQLANQVDLVVVALVVLPMLDLVMQEDLEQDMDPDHH